MTEGKGPLSEEARPPGSRGSARGARQILRVLRGAPWRHLVGQPHLRSAGGPAGQPGAAPRLWTAQQ